MTEQQACIVYALIDAMAEYRASLQPVTFKLGEMEAAQAAIDARRQAILARLDTATATARDMLATR